MEPVEQVAVDEREHHGDSDGTAGVEAKAALENVIEGMKEVVVAALQPVNPALQGYYNLSRRDLVSCSTAKQTCSAGLISNRVWCCSAAGCHCSAGMKH